MAHSPSLSAIASASLLVHAALGTAMWAVSVDARRPRLERPVDVEILEPPPPPPPPPVVTPPPPPPVETPPPPPPPAERITRSPPREAPRQAPPPPIEPPTSAEPPAPGEPSSGDPAPMIQMDSLGTDSTGVQVGYGRPTTRRVGGGGNGTGSGGGGGTEPTGTGAAPVAVSIASIKSQAKPKGDYDYFDAKKDYPPDARRLGIEGTIQVRLLVDDQGEVAKRTLLNHLGHGLDQLALRRAAAMEFEPARDSDDRAVASYVVWSFRFLLPD